MAGGEKVLTLKNGTVAARWATEAVHNFVLRLNSTYPVRLAAPCVAVVSALLLSQIGPLQDGVQRRTECLAPRRETVFHLRRYLGVDFAHDNPVSLHLTELLAEHLLRDVRNRSLQIREAQHLAPKQMKQDD
jgi:hypothetical protein